MILPHVLKLSLHSIEYPPQYRSHPPAVLKLSPTVLNNLHTTKAIPPQYWIYPPTCTNVIPTILKLSLNSTEQPPQYLSYPPHVLMLFPNFTDVILPLYWTTSTVLKLCSHCIEVPPLYWATSKAMKLSLTVLKLFPQSNDGIPRCTEQPLMYWTTSTVLNQRYTGWLSFLGYHIIW